MPGAVGGDLVKAYLVARAAGQRKAEAVATVIIDRVIGLLAMIVLTAGVMAVFLPFFLQHPATRAALWLCGGALGGAVGFFLLAFRQDLFARWVLFRRLEEQTRIGRILSRVYRAFRLCLTHPGLLFLTSLLSLANHVAFVGCAWLLGRALRIPLAFLDYLRIFPVINAVAAIPVTPGGLGTREGMSVFLLGAVHVPATSAMALSLLLYGVVLIWSLIGGLVYVSYLYAYGSRLREDLNRLAEEGMDSDDGKA